MDHDREWRPRNFRDVGRSLTSCGAASEITIPPGRLLRGGDIDLLFLAQQHECIGHPHTILNLRVKEDNPGTFGDIPIRYLHFPTKNGAHDYDTTAKSLRLWIRQVISALCELQVADMPLYVHCRSGKDRTGVIVGIILLILGFPVEDVVQEYLRSQEGDISETGIRTALAPYASPQQREKEFKKCNLAHLARLLLAL